MIIGVLAIQGAYWKHQQVLNNIGVENCLIRHPGELTVDALIIPGGESTTITKVLREERWLETIIQYARSHPVFGTCAGAILLGREVDSPKVTPWQIIDMQISRNAYGRQINSFIGDISLLNHSGQHRIPGVFIRAPKITHLGQDVRILGTCNGDPVLVKQGSALASTFHPELTDNTTIHRYFVEQLCRESSVKTVPEELKLP